MKFIKWKVPALIEMGSAQKLAAVLLPILIGIAGYSFLRIESIWTDLDRPSPFIEKLPLELAEVKREFASQSVTDPIVHRFTVRLNEMEHAQVGRMQQVSTVELKKWLRIIISARTEIYTDHGKLNQFQAENYPIASISARATEKLLLKEDSAWAALQEFIKICAKVNSSFVEKERAHQAYITVNLELIGDINSLSATNKALFETNNKLQTAFNTQWNTHFKTKTSMHRNLLVYFTFFTVASIFSAIACFVIGGYAIKKRVPSTIILN